MEKKPSIPPCQMGFQAVTTSRGDGSFVIAPGKPVRELRPQAAAKYIGVCKTRMYEMVSLGRVESRRPSAGVIWVRVDGGRGLDAWKTRTADPEFWEREAQNQARLNGRTSQKKKPL
jgi:hypothetical protein